MVVRTAKAREVDYMRHGSVDGLPLATALGDSRVYVCSGQESPPRFENKNGCCTVYKGTLSREQSTLVQSANDLSPLFRLLMGVSLNFPHDGHCQAPNSLLWCPGDPGTGLRSTPAGIMAGVLGVPTPFRGQGGWQCGGLVDGGGCFPASSPMSSVVDGIMSKADGFS